MARESSPKPKLRPKKSIGEKVKDFADKYNLTGPPTPATKAAQERFLSRDAPSRQGGLPSLANTNLGNLGGLTKQKQYDENLRRYNEYMESQGPAKPEVTPEMRREALSMFESQQGAGQVPYYMAAARNAQNPNMSPAFQYAAQNYDVLGGSQRIAPRPMEMMSVAERGQINDMAQAMADEQARKQAEEAEYRRGLDMVMRGGGKGGPRTGPQMPRDPYMPRFGGKGRGGVAPQIPPMRQPPSRQPVMHDGRPIPFASMLASRFGGFGG